MAVSKTVDSAVERDDNIGVVVANHERPLLGVLKPSFLADVICERRRVSSVAREVKSKLHTQNITHVHVVGHTDRRVDLVDAWRRREPHAKEHRDGKSRRDAHRSPRAKRSSSRHEWDARRGNSECRLGAGGDGRGEGVAGGNGEGAFGRSEDSGGSTLDGSLLRLVVLDC